MAKSEAGEPGFEIEVDGERMPFHLAFKDAMDDALDRAENVAWNLATGKHKQPLQYQGRVQYKIDPRLHSLGFIGPDAYLLDDEGKPIPEQMETIDPDMLRFMLKAHRPETYVATQKVDVTHRGGVLVVGTQMTRDDFQKQFVNTRPEAIDVEFEVEDDNTGAKNDTP